MKKVHKVSIVVTSIIVAITFLFIGCNKEDALKKVDNNQTQKSGSTNKATSTGTCACDVMPSNCSSKFKKCSKQLLNNGDSRNFVINWTSATACGSTLPPNTYGHLCYTGSCNEFYLELTSSIPLCLSCYPEPYCIKATSVSFTNKCSFSLQYTSDDGTQVITITGDPHISIQCSPVSGISSTCDGDLTWL
jgi:hypothetical protein